MLADAIQAWAKVPAVVVEVKPAPTMKEGPYGPIHEAPADILMGSLAVEPAPQPDIIHHGVAIEVKAKRSYTRKTKNE
jgi:hypothetical protein